MATYDAINLLLNGGILPSTEGWDSDSPMPAFAVPITVHDRDLNDIVADLIAVSEPCSVEHGISRWCRADGAVLYADELLDPNVVRVIPPAYARLLPRTLDALVRNWKREPLNLVSPSNFLDYAVCSIVSRHDSLSIVVRSSATSLVSFTLLRLSLRYGLGLSRDDNDSTGHSTFVFTNA